MTLKTLFANNILPRAVFWRKFISSMNLTLLQMFLMSITCIRLDAFANERRINVSNLHGVEFLGSSTHNK